MISEDLEIEAKPIPKTEIKGGISWTRLASFSLRFNQFLAVIAGVVMVSVALLIVTNIIIRIFHAPIPGVGEISGWMSAITAAFALGYTQVHRGHVDMDLLVNKFPPGIRRAVQSLMLLLSMLFFGIISCRLYWYANNIRIEGALSETLAVIYYPYVYLMALGFAGLTLALLTDFIIMTFKGERP